MKAQHNNDDVCSIPVLGNAENAWKRLSYNIKLKVTIMKKQAHLYTYYFITSFRSFFGSPVGCKAL